VHPSTPQALIGERTSSHCWHKRLGHPALRIVNHVLSKFKLPILSNNALPPCPQAKGHQLPFSISTTKICNPLELLYYNVWGPSPTLSINGNRYYVSFVDAFTCFTWVYPIQSKSEVMPVFIKFQTMIERLLNAKIKCVQSDWGGEYRNPNKYFQSIGIIHHVSYPHTHQQQGCVERKHRHLIDTALALLIDSSIPKLFWDEACLTSYYLINRLPTPLLQNIYPSEKLFSRSPDYKFLKVFGCACFPNLRPYNSHKFSLRSKQCVFLGYSSHHKGYKCYHQESGGVFISRDVVFQEIVFPFSKHTSHSTPSSHNLPTSSTFTLPILPTIVSGSIPSNPLPLPPASSISHSPPSSPI
jgi:hypothetical protein